MQDYPADPNPIITPAPPQSIEAERSVIGALLQSSHAVSQAVEQLVPDDFFSPEHRAVYEAVLSLFSASRSVDFLTVNDELTASGRIELVGGMKYLVECVRFVPTTANLSSYIGIVKEKSNLRRLIHMAQDIQSRCYSQADASGDILLSAESSLSSFGAKAQNSPNKPIAIKDVLSSVFDKIERNCAQRGVIDGVPTGFYDLDRMLTGLHPGELIIVGARPAMGKTSFALSAAHFASVCARKNVLFFSLEMPVEQLATRILSLHSHVPMQSMRAGTVSEKEWVLMADATNELSVDTLVIDDTPSISPSQMRSRIRSLIASGFTPQVVMVDYLGIVSADQKSENRQNEVSAITRQLKSLARELKIPFVVLAQLSRANAARGDKRPVLTDLRETGSVEQEADAVVFLHREAYYDQSQDQSEAVLILAKQRNGPVGDVPVRWDLQTASYQNLPGTLVARYQ